ncbi:unnamed protein product [Closterium sp. Naga37s-1]|nr:unnamed protein product [Closterium sp. Naga37s-1]
MRFDPVGLSLPNHYPIARSAIPIGRTAPFAQYSCEFRSANPAASRNVLSQCNRPRCLLIRRFPRSRNQITMSADVAQTADVAEPADWRVLITFDVDGTLIHSVGSESNKLHKRAFAHAMKKVFGIQGTIDAIQQRHFFLPPIFPFPDFFTFPYFRLSLSPTSPFSATLFPSRNLSSPPVPTLSPLNPPLTPRQHGPGSADQHAPVLQPLDFPSPLEHHISLPQSLLPLFPPAPLSLLNPPPLPRQHHGSTDQAVLINTLEFYGIPRHVTGNLEAIAWLKMAGLEVASLFTAPRIGGFGSDHMDRGELVRIARQRAEERIAGPPFRLHAHVGDTVRYA